MSRVEEFIAKMNAESKSAIDETIKVLCDKYAKSEEDCQEIKSLIMGVVYIGEGIGHLKDWYQEIVFKREEKNVKKE